MTLQEKTDRGIRVLFLPVKIICLPSVTRTSSGSCSESGMQGLSLRREGAGVIGSDHRQGVRPSTSTLPGSGHLAIAANHEAQLDKC